MRRATNRHRHESLEKAIQDFQPSSVKDFENICERCTNTDDWVSNRSEGLESILVYAVRSGHLQILKIIMQNFSPKSNDWYLKQSWFFDKNGAHVLSIAIKEAKCDIVEYLVKNLDKDEIFSLLVSQDSIHQNSFDDNTLTVITNFLIGNEKYRIPLGKVLNGQQILLNAGLCRDCTFSQSQNITCVSDAHFEQSARFWLKRNEPVLCLTLIDNNFLELPAMAFFQEVCKSGAIHIDTTPAQWCLLLTALRKASICSGVSYLKRIAFEQYFEESSDTSAFKKLHSLAKSILPQAKFIGWDYLSFLNEEDIKTALKKYDSDIKEELWIDGNVVYSGGNIEKKKQNFIETKQQNFIEKKKHNFKFDSSRPMTPQVSRSRVDKFQIITLLLLVSIIVMIARWFKSLFI